MLLDTAERLSTEIIKRDPSIKERLLGLLSDFQTLELVEVLMHMSGDFNNTLSGWEELQSDSISCPLFLMLSM